MNIDPHLMRGLSYFKNSARTAVYTSIDQQSENSDYDADTGVLSSGSADYTIKALVQRYENSVLGEVISSEDRLCIIFGKLTFEPKDDDILLQDGITYLVNKTYKTISNQVAILNVRKQ